MAELKKYLYNGLSFKVSTGLNPILINDTIVEIKKSVPKLTWNIDFGEVDTELKNAIEATIVQSPNNTTILSFIRPGFLIGKSIDIVSGTVQYYITYFFEHSFYGRFVDKPLSHVVVGNTHVIEGVITLDANQAEGDTPFIITESINLPVKLFFQEDSIDISHQYSGVFKLQLPFTEQAKPLALDTVFIVGGSNASYLDLC